MRQVRAQVETIRPGRPLFVREWILGVDDVPPKHKDDKNTVDVDLQIMIVHGSCATERQFHYLLLSLEAKIQALPRRTAVRCVLFDGVGCGESPILTRYNEYSPENMMADLQVIVESYMDPKVPLIWMGHSYGTSLILRLLASSSSSSNDDDESSASAPLARGRPCRLAKDGLIFMGSAVPVFILQCLQPILSRHFVQMAVHPTNRWVRTECLARTNNTSLSCFMIRSFYRQSVWATQEDLSKVATSAVPLLVVHGCNDGVIPLKYGQALANAMPNSTLCPIDQASHLVMMEKADVVASKVLEFLQKHFLN